MSIYSYRVFRAVSREQSFSKAAKVLNMSPSAVSHAVAKLEDEFGFKLFVRGKKSATLTDSGRQVAGYIDEMLDAEDMLEKRISQINGSTVGEINFGVIDSVTVSRLGRILDAYKEQHPDITVNVKENGYFNLIDGVISHDLDMAIVSHTAVRGLSTPLQFVPVLKDRIICVLPDTARTKSGDSISLEELSGMPLIFQPNGDEIDIEEFFENNGVPTDIKNTAITNTSLTAMVRYGLGAGIMCELSLSCCDLDGLSVYPIVPSGARTLGIVSRDRRFLTPAAREFMSCVQDAFM